VTDFEDLSLSFPGVSKAAAYLAETPDSGDISTVTIYAVPFVPNYTELDDPIQASYTLTSLGTDGDYINTELASYLEERAVLGTGVSVNNSVLFEYIYLKINTLAVRPGYIRYDVETRVREALTNAFAFDAVSFGQTIHIGDLYRTILSVPGVDYVDIEGIDTFTSGFPATPASVTYAAVDTTVADGRLPRLNTDPAIGLYIVNRVGGITGSN
jgi:hypothetical protein